MHSFKALLLLAFTNSIALAFTIPEGTPDGVYSVHLDDAGKEVHALLANASDTIDADPQQPQALVRSMGEPWTRLDKRDSFGVSCGGTYGMHRGDTDAANADLDRQCGNGAQVQPRHNYYSIRGDVVAFFCNFSEAACKVGCCSTRPCAAFGHVRCYAGGRQADSRHITERCGRYNSGWTTVYKGDHHWSFGYDSKYSRFCGS